MSSGRALLSTLVLVPSSSDVSVLKYCDVGDSRPEAGAISLSEVNGLVLVVSDRGVKIREMDLVVVDVDVKAVTVHDGWTVQQHAARQRSWLRNSMVGNKAMRCRDGAAAGGVGQQQTTPREGEEEKWTVDCEW